MAQSLVSGVSGHKEAQRMTDMAEKFEKIQNVIIFLRMDEFRNYFLYPSVVGLLLTADVLTSAGWPGYKVCCGGPLILPGFEASLEEVCGNI